MGLPCTLIFDIGKTNKKIFLFDQEYNVIWHEHIQLDEIQDDDGFPCEDLEALTTWIKDKTKQIIANPDYDVKSMNFTTYGASLVHLNKDSKVISPFYNYLKPFREELKSKFLKTYFGDEDEFSLTTSSPYLGMLNSGLQQYFIKHQKPEIFQRTNRSLHFPQYLSSLFTNEWIADYTSLGCHTGLWDFNKSDYAKWLKKEKLQNILAPVIKSDASYLCNVYGKICRVGIGVHDSSAALYSYLNSPQEEPFLLLSTGTWNICLNPFATEHLTPEELKLDCLQYLSKNGKSVKASRLFMGEHFNNVIQNLSEFYHVDIEYYKTISFNNNFMTKGISSPLLQFNHDTLKPERFGFVNNPDQNLSILYSFDNAYKILMNELLDIQIASLRLAIGGSYIENILVDGGFSNNEVFVEILTAKLQEYQVETRQMKNGSALGAALLVNS